MKNSNLFNTRSWIISALLIVCVIKLTAQNELIGYTHLVTEGHSYYYSNCKATWEEANEAAMEMGGYLATLTTWWELEGLTYGIQYSPYIPHTDFWIGLRGENGIYEWANGEPGSNFWWSGNEQPVHPDGAVVIRQSYEYYAAWVSHPVSYETEYLVEFPVSPNCNNNPNKTYVCHNGNTICVNNSALQSHLDHGDLEGPCGPCNTYAMQALPDDEPVIAGQSIHTTTVVLSEPKTEHVGIPAKTTSDQIQVNPNPASSEIQIVLPEGSQEGTLRILSLTGQEIRTLPLFGQQSITFDLSDYTPGVYLIDIRCAGGHYQKKFVKL